MRKYNVTYFEQIEANSPEEAASKAQDRMYFGTNGDGQSAFILVRDVTSHRAKRIQLGPKGGSTRTAAQGA